MIREIYSDLPSFKGLKFNRGLNIILVSKTNDASDKQTRNKAGKTSLTELIHLMLGADVDKDCLICENKLSRFNFGMRFDLGEETVSVERSCVAKSRVVFNENRFPTWPVQPKWDQTLSKFIIRNNSWKELLGHFMFDLPFHENEKDKLSFTTTFRSLISYFVRRENEGGFREPELNSVSQQLWDSQMAISLLIGFDWNVPYQFQQIRIREKTVRELKKLLSGQEELQGLDSIGDLRTKAAVTERNVDKLRKELEEFRVLERYHDLENEANSLTMRISQFLDENILDKEYQLTLTDSLNSEEPPDTDEVLGIYKEAISEVPSIVKKKLEDARIFYDAIVNNRRLYLEGEISELKRKIASREKAIAESESRKSEIMNILNSHGALEQYSALQLELSRQRGALGTVNSRIKMLEELSETKSQAKLERAKLELLLKKNYNEQADTYRKAIDKFEDFSSQFYESPGSLVIEPTSNGPKFSVKIQGERSKGIKNVQIFCFDMMLMEILRSRHTGPDFLIHDSHLFDGVDERQVATALKIGKETAERLGFQYIVTMNSDVFPDKNVIGSDLCEYVLPVDLNDKTEVGGLFGLRF